MGSKNILYPAVPSSKNYQYPAKNILYLVLNISVEIEKIISDVSCLHTKPNKNLFSSSEAGISSGHEVKAIQLKVTKLVG